MCLFEIIVHYYLVKDARRVSVSKLDFGLGQSLLNLLLIFRATTPQPRLQRLEARRFDESIARIDAVIFLHLPDALHVNIQHDYAAFCRLVCDGPFAGAVVVSAEVGELDDRTLCDEGRKFGLGNEEVVLALEFANPRLTCRVGYSQCKCIVVSDIEPVR